MKLNKAKRQLKQVRRLLKQAHGLVEGMLNDKPAGATDDTMDEVSVLVGFLHNSSEDVRTLRKAFGKEAKVKKPAAVAEKTPA